MPCTSCPCANFVKGATDEFVRGYERHSGARQSREPEIHNHDRAYGFRRRIPDHALVTFCARQRPGQAESFAQRLALVVTMEQVAALQLRHDKAYKIFISAGYMGRRDHESVAAAAREPLFELVRDHLRRPDKGRHLTHRSSATKVD